MKGGGGGEEQEEGIGGGEEQGGGEITEVQKEKRKKLEKGRKITNEQKEVEIEGGEDEQDKEEGRGEAQEEKAGNKRKEECFPLFLSLAVDPKHCGEVPTLLRACIPGRLRGSAFPALCAQIPGLQNKVVK
jgi:hypothetical protein